MRRIILSILAVLLIALMFASCNKNKKDSKTAIDTDAGVIDDSEEEVSQESPIVEDNSNATPPVPSGPHAAIFPPAPSNDYSGRNPSEYLVSIKKAQLIPAKPSTECWDECNDQAQTAISAAVSKLGVVSSQKDFDMAAKLMEGGIGLVGGQNSFPDVFVHIRCGHSQGHKTKVVQDKMIATWKYENKKMKLDPRDECVISLWDNDNETDEEIGRTTVQMVQMANNNNGTALIYGQEVGFGLVYSLELSITPYNASSTSNNNSSNNNSSNNNSSNNGNSATSYSVEIIKAEIEKKKSDGAQWDAAPGGGMLGSIVGKVGGVKPDPFVEGWVNGYKSAKSFVKTSTKKENYYPKWNTTERIRLKGTDHINFMVWDGDAAQHDLIGECKTKPMNEQHTGEVWIKGCGQVKYLLVKITKN